VPDGGQLGVARAQYCYADEIHANETSAHPIGKAARILIVATFDSTKLIIPRGDTTPGPLSRASAQTIVLFRSQCAPKIYPGMTFPVRPGKLPTIRTREKSDGRQLSEVR
jgi:hypothetical protein